MTQDNALLTCKQGHPVGPSDITCPTCRTPATAQCSNGHAVDTSDRYCPACGGAVTPRALSLPVDTAPDLAAEMAEKRRSKGTKLAVAGLAVVAAVAAGVFTLSQLGGNKADAPASAAGAIGMIECVERPAGIPPGTDLLTVSLDENTPERVTMTAIFDGDVPPDRRDTTYTLMLELFLFVDKNDTRPYRVAIFSTFGPYSAQAGRINGGFIDSSSFDLTVRGDTMRITFDPSAFIELPAGELFPFAAQTLIQELTPGQGYVAAGVEKCGIK